MGLLFWGALLGAVVVFVTAKAIRSLVRREPYTLSRLDGGIFAGRRMHPVIPLILAVALTGGALAIVNRAIPLWRMGTKPCEALLTPEWSARLLGRPAEPKDVYLHALRDGRACEASVWDPLKRSGSGRIVDVSVTAPATKDFDFYFRMREQDLARDLSRVPAEPIGTASVAFAAAPGSPGRGYVFRTDDLVVSVRLWVEIDPDLEAAFEEHLRARAGAL
jgi:hypothetical protein